MKYSFQANEVVIAIQTFDGAYPDVVSVGFGDMDADYNALQHVILQNSVKDDGDGWGYYLEYCDQNNSKYDCLELFELSRNSARLVFKEDVDFAEEIFISFETDEEHFEEVKKALREAIFRDSECFSVASE